MKKQRPIKKQPPPEESKTNMPILLHFNYNL
jgi:hypothetical protein